MSPSSKLSKLALPGVVLLVLAGVASIALVSLALARSFALSIANAATVTNANTHASVRENIVVNGKRHAVYTLTGDSMKHPLCTAKNGCFQFWPPVTTTAKKPAAAPGIRGKLGIWHRNGFAQLTLNGHPLYTFVEDKRANDANGEAFHGFGGTWHVLRSKGASHQVSSTPTTTTTTPTYTAPGYTTPGTTPTTTIPYYP
jgi:predicted lipoprotein with Yx(FWY)xxD motif